MSNSAVIINKPAPDWVVRLGSLHYMDAVVAAYAKQNSTLMKAMFPEVVNVPADEFADFQTALRAGLLPWTKA